MSQNIECTECHDLVVLEGGRSITIPFICRVCEAAEPCDCESKYEPSAEGEPTAVTAVQDATAIIADLQQQLTQLTEYVADIETQLQKSRQDSYAYELLASTLENDKKFINQHNIEISKQSSILRQDLKSALGIAQNLA